MKNLKNIIFAILVLSFTSCDLDEVPTGQIVLETAITDKVTAENALNGVYYQFAGRNTSHTGREQINWTFNNEIFPAQLAGLMYYRFGGLGRDTNMNSVFSRDIETMWQNKYKTVAAANGVLERVPQLADSEFDGDRKKEILGEASFLRAYSNFSLLCYFGKFYDTQSKDGIIIRNKLTTATKIVTPRSTVLQSYESIIKDLDYAIANCPKTNPKHYATVWTAKLLKARVLMYRGIKTDYNVANTLALDVINNSNFKLDSLHNLFTINGKNSPEIMLHLKPEPSQRAHTLIYYTRRGKDDPAYFATNEFLQLASTDPRALLMFGYGPESLDSLKKGKKALGFSIFKYVDVPNVKVVEDAYAIRLTEAYLIAAETSARLGDIASAKTRLKSVMEKARVRDFRKVDAANNEEDILFEIYKEYTLNMCFEDGHEWFAILRCLPFEKVKQIRPGIVSKNQYIMPISDKELTRNSLITQNTGYAIPK